MPPLPDLFAARRIVDEQRRNHLADTLCLTGPQWEALQIRDAAAAIWGANKIGKTELVAFDALSFLRGTHPFDQTHQPPVEVCVVGESFSAMFQTLSRTWAYMDKREFRSCIKFVGGKFTGQKYPILDVLSGPGRGGHLHIRTYSEGAERLAGPVYHRVLTDEPMGEDVYNELWPRLASVGGHLRIYYTPTAGTDEDLTYLWKLCDDGVVREFQVPMNVDAVTPRFYADGRRALITGPWMSRRAIADFEAGFTGLEREMRMGRSRHVRYGQRFFGRWDPKTCLMDPYETSPVGVPLGVGMDHGVKAGTQFGVAAAVQPEPDPRIWILAESWDDKRTSQRVDARDILSMLTSIGQTVWNVDQFKGDRAHGGDMYGAQKDNRGFVGSMAEELHCGKDGLPLPLRMIEVPFKRRGRAHSDGATLNDLMGRGRFRVHPRCVQTIRSVENWDGSTKADDPWKHAIDGVCYIAIEMTERAPLRMVS